LSLFFFLSFFSLYLKEELKRKERRKEKAQIPDGGGRLSTNPVRDHHHGAACIGERICRNAGRRKLGEKGRYHTPTRGPGTSDPKQ
jgi:hypothetical protein